MKTTALILTLTATIAIGLNWHARSEAAKRVPCPVTMAFDLAGLAR